MPAAKLIYKERGVKRKGGGQFVQIEQTETFELTKIKNVSAEININKKTLVTRGHKNTLKTHLDFRKCLQYFLVFTSKVCLQGLYT